MVFVHVKPPKGVVNLIDNDIIRLGFAIVGGVNIGRVPNYGILDNNVVCLREKLEEWMRALFAFVQFVFSFCACVSVSVYVCVRLCICFLFLKLLS